MAAPTVNYEMNELLELVVEQNASDLHLQVGQPPTLRLSGSMTPIDGPPLTALDTEKLMLAITPDIHVRSECVRSAPAGRAAPDAAPERQHDPHRRAAAHGARH